MHDIANEKGIIVKAMECDNEYIHLMVDYSPKKSVKENALFSDGYFSCSIGEAVQKQLRNIFNHKDNNDNNDNKDNKDNIVVSFTTLKCTWFPEREKR